MGHSGGCSATQALRTVGTQSNSEETQQLATPQRLNRSLKIKEESKITSRKSSEAEQSIR